VEILNIMLSKDLAEQERVIQSELPEVVC